MFFAATDLEVRQNTTCEGERTLLFKKKRYTITL